MNPLRPLVTRVRRSSAGLIARLHRWAESGWAGPVVGGWGLLQGSVFPGPSDALFAPLGLADPGRIWRLAAWAALGSTMGSALAYLVGLHAFDGIGAAMLSLAGVDGHALDSVRGLFAERGWLIVLASSFTPVSVKLVCVAAGALGVPPAEFLAAIATGRTLRYVAVALALRFAGGRLVGVLSRGAEG